MRFLPVVAGVLAAAAAFAQAPLAITTTASQVPPGTVGSLYLLTFTASGGTAPLTWSSTGTLPPGITLNSAGVMLGTPSAAGTFPFTVIVTDSKQVAASKSFSLVIAGSGSGNLSISTQTLPAGAVGQSYGQTLAATGGKPPYQWSVGTGLPGGLTLDAATGQIAGTPTTAGSYSFQVQVTDSSNARASARLTLAVAGLPLTITTTGPLFNGTVGLAYAQQFAATGGTPPYTWSVLSGNTGGLVIDAAAGTLQGTPQSAATLSFTIQVADSVGGKASKAYSITVQASSLVIALGAALPPGTVGTAYSQKIAAVATGGTPPYTWALTGTVPGLAFDPGSMVLSGTPTTAGVFAPVLQATDSAGHSGTRALSLTIASQDLTITTGRQLAAGNVNTPYSVSLTVAGGVPPYSWSAAGLPAGLTIDAASGTISGTPTAGGIFNPVVISVRDSALNHYSDIFSLTVGLPALPAVTISGLPATANPAQQYTLQIALASPYSAAITGQAILSFSPQSGAGDSTIVFASGGTTANFTIAAGTVAAVSQVPLAIQTGTAAGTINISLRFQAGGVDITPASAPSASTTIGTAAPVITGTQVTRTSNSITISVTGYSSTLEVTQAVFAFTAASGQSLQTAATSMTLDVSNLFGKFLATSTMGGQFVYTQPFTVQGDPTAVIPVSVKLTNRVGSTTANINP